MLGNTCVEDENLRSFVFISLGEAVLLEHLSFNGVEAAYMLRH